MVDLPSYKRLFYGARGSGKLRHTRANMLWVQEKSASDELHYKKVEGTNNADDLMTKYLNRTQIDKYLEMLGVSIQGGRAAGALDLDTGVGVGTRSAGKKEASRAAQAQD